MRTAVLTLMLITGIDAADTTGFHALQAISPADRYGHRGTITHTVNHTDRAGAHSGERLFHSSEFHRTGKAAGSITLPHINVTKNGRSYDLLGKETTINRKTVPKRSRKWHEQVLNLFR